MRPSASVSRKSATFENQDALPSDIGDRDRPSSGHGQALLVGTNDLCMEMGIPGQVGHDRVAAAYETIIAACHKHAKVPALGGVYTPDLMERYVGMGMRMVLGGSDLSMMMAAAKERSGFLRGLAHG